MLTLLLLGYLALMLFKKDPSLFLPGDTSDGHYQIESDCTACHTGFSGVLQEACLNCHDDELQSVNDSHPPKKFTDPRNASKLALIDARYCVSCHREHRPSMTHSMGVTLAEDFCVYCHSDIASDRPSHADLAFDTCRLCHLYHDNTALYEDFLIQHLNEPRILPQARVPQRNLLASYRRTAQHPLVRLSAADQDAPESVEWNQARDWEGTSHGNSGVNCMACHARQETAKTGGMSDWVDKPDHTACARCHAKETQGFLTGRHGMRQAQGMPAMHTGLARRLMAGLNKTVNCVACHPAHRFDTREAAVEACLGCHDDEHSKAYKGSAHYQLWRAEMAGQGKPGSGVSCATCHLPRQLADDKDVEHNLVQHNQNLNLRPNQKMVRGVCLYCHGLGYTLNALADRELINSNFTGNPTMHIESLEMAAKRLDKHE